MTRLSLRVLFSRLSHSFSSSHSTPLSVFHYFTPLSPFRSHSFSFLSLLSRLFPLNPLSRTAAVALPFIKTAGCRGFAFLTDSGSSVISSWSSDLTPRITFVGDFVGNFFRSHSTQHLRSFVHRSFVIPVRFPLFPRRSFTKIRFALHRLRLFETRSGLPAP